MKKLKQLPAFVYFIIGFMVFFTIGWLLIMAFKRSILTGFMA